MLSQYRILYIWVEGDDDRRFFDRMVKPIFQKTYDQVILVAYAQMPKKKIAEFFKSIKAMNAQYFFCA